MGHLNIVNQFAELLPRALLPGTNIEIKKTRPEPPPIENISFEELTEQPPPIFDGPVGGDKDDHDHYPFLNGVASREQDSASTSLAGYSFLPFVLLGLCLR